MEETPDGSSSLASLDGCNVCSEAEAQRPQAVSAGADAGAAVPLQSGLRRLWKDSVSRAHPEGGAFSRRVLQGGGRVRRADGLARLHVRQGSRPEPLPGQGEVAQDVPRHSLQPQEGVEVQHPSALLRVSDGQAKLRVYPLGHADLFDLRLAKALLSPSGWLR